MCDQTFFKNTKSNCVLCFFGFLFALLIVDVSAIEDVGGWPKNVLRLDRDPVLEKRLERIVSQMSLQQKVGQIIQADIAQISPADIRKYRLGSILSGGTSSPNGDKHASPEEWLGLADQFYQASMDVPEGEIAIPILWGSDAVHGNNNLLGATVFPHNIGLGAANNEELIKKIGEITAKEVLVTGLDWTFAPTLAVARDDRWGRTYESYSEDPAIVEKYAKAMVAGIQGEFGTSGFLSDAHILATAKHFVGDGGTRDGKDQGDNLSSVEQMRDIHAPGYYTAIDAAVQTVMASFNSWHGEKMHGNKTMLTDVLVGRMGFDGFVVGDWNGHGQVKGCSNVSCPKAFMAGIDMFMAPDSWKELYHNTVAQVKSGEISLERLNQAVSRIIRVKLRLGLFEKGRPSSRAYAGNIALVGSKPHRKVARQAVRESLVLLKNNNSVLPINPTQHILLAGDGADNIAKQSGGWTLSWQGDGNSNDDFKNGDSIYSAFLRLVEQAGGSIELSEQGSYKRKPDVAVVVFGENPYAEGVGDRDHLDFSDGRGLKILRTLKEKGIPTVGVFLSGRPMYVNPEINASDAFVAAFLPGTEAKGMTDVMLAHKDGNMQYDFSGKLSFSWPKDPKQTSLNIGDEDYDPLFAYGYGLTYQSKKVLEALDESADGVEESRTNDYLCKGRPSSSNSLWIAAGGKRVKVEGSNAKVDNAVSIRSVDWKLQEDAREINWQNAATLYLQAEPIDLSFHANAQMLLQFNANVLAHSEADAFVSLECGEDCDLNKVDISESFAKNLGKGWQSYKIPLSQFATSAKELSSIIRPFVLTAGAGLVLQISDISVVASDSGAVCND